MVKQIMLGLTIQFKKNDEISGKRLETPIRVLQYLTGKVFACTLQVELTNKPFGDSGASVQINGPDGYVDTKWFEWASI